MLLYLQLLLLGRQLDVSVKEIIVHLSDHQWHRIVAREGRSDGEREKEKDKIQDVSPFLMTQITKKENIFILTKVEAVATGNRIYGLSRESLISGLLKEPKTGDPLLTPLLTLLGKRRFNTFEENQRSSRTWTRVNRLQEFGNAKNRQTEDCSHSKDASRRGEYLEMWGISINFTDRNPF
jgi:hypothetical protein